MRPAVLSLTLAAAVIAITPIRVRAQVQRPPSAQAAEAANATASIRGRITAADSGKGLRRAQVSISGGDLPQRRTAATNTRGEFEIRDLLPGRYTLSASRSGYLAYEYGQLRPGEHGKVLEVAEGEAMTAIDIALPRAGVVSGRVIDENGEAVPGVRIWVMRQQFFRGRTRLVPVSAGIRTDDTGQYRATGLGPGEYVVLATLGETWTAGGEKKQVLGYAPTFFPSTASAADAQHVKLAAGKEASSVDIALIASPAATISGTARRSDGAPLAGASVGLTQMMIGPGSSSFSGITSATAGADGGWVLRDVPPGEYVLEVSSADRNRTRESASMKLMVQGADIDGVSLVTEGPVRVSGEVITESGVPVPESTRGRPRVVIETTGDRRPTQIPTGDDNGQVKSDGTFTFTAVSGPSLVTVSPLPRGWAVKSVEIGGRDMPDGAIELKGGQAIDGARIVLTNRFPSVSGRVTDDRAADAEGTVLLFPADESRWLTAASGLRTGRTSQKGIFEFAGVPPGDYLLVALAAVQTWQVNDPEFLAEMKPRAERVTINEGQNAQLTLRLRK
jgi:hypothetical protein